MIAKRYFSVACYAKRIVIPRDRGITKSVAIAKAEESFARKNGKDACARMAAKKAGKITIRKFSFDE
tara:strand:+ start:73 stop:273 length:201 start_codon:yes stop_codon:yes gene_type:complete